MTIDKRSGTWIALLVRDAGDGLQLAGGAFITLRGRDRERSGNEIAHLASTRPVIAALKRRAVQWVKPELAGGVRHLRGPGALCDATFRDLADR